MFKLKDTLKSCNGDQNKTAFGGMLTLHSSIKLYSTLVISIEHKDSAKIIDFKFDIRLAKQSLNFRS